MKTVSRQKVISFLKELGVDPDCVYSVVIVPGEISIYAYDRRGEDTMKTVSRQKVISFLKELGVDPDCVYSVVIVPGEISIYAYDLDADGRPFLIPGTSRIAEKLERVLIA